MSTTVNFQARVRVRVRVALVWVGLALSAAGCGQAVAQVEARGEPARSTEADADVAAAESGTSAQIVSGIEVEVCAPADISVPTTAGRPPAPQGDMPTSTVGPETIRASDADFEKLGALGLGRIALCDGATGYIELGSNDAGCYTVFSDPERSRTLGQQRAMASLQVLHPMGSDC